MELKAAFFVYIVLMGITTLTTSIFYIWNLDGMEDSQYLRLLKCPHGFPFSVTKVKEETLVWGKREYVPVQVPPACQSKYIWHLYSIFCFFGGFSYFFYLFIRNRNCTWKVPEEPSEVDLNRIDFVAFRETERLWAREAMCSNWGFYSALLCSFIGLISTTAVAFGFIPLSIYPEQFRVRGQTVRPLAVILFILSPLHFVQFLALLARCCCGKSCANQKSDDEENSVDGVKLEQEEL